MNNVNDQRFPLHPIYTRSISKNASFAVIVQIKLYVTEVNNGQFYIKAISNHMEQLHFLFVCNRVDNIIYLKHDVNLMVRESIYRDFHMFQNNQAVVGHTSSECNR